MLASLGRTPWVTWAALVCLGAALGGGLPAATAARKTSGRGLVPSPPSPNLGERDLLDRVERAAARYFVEEAHPATGLVKDRAANWGRDDYTVCNIAPTGMGLAALGVAAQRGWLPRGEAVRQARRTLDFVERRVPQDHGWVPRFLDWRTGQRAWNCETSTIDTTLFIWGARLAARLLGDARVSAAADRLSRRLDWDYVRTNAGARPRGLLVSHGIDAGGAFLPNTWDNYSEGVLIYFLGLGADRPLPRASWSAWHRNWGEYQGLRTYATPPLFVFLMPMSLLDLRRFRDTEGSDLWGALVRKVDADRRFCALSLAAGPSGVAAGGPARPAAQESGDTSAAGLVEAENSGRSPAATRAPLPLFGVSACDGPEGYRAYGAPPGDASYDGTLHPPMMASSIIARPKETLAGLRWLLAHQRGGGAPPWRIRPAVQGTPAPSPLWGKYGLPGGLNPVTGFVARDQIGLDLAILVLALENRRSGLVWRTMSQDPWFRRALRRIAAPA